MLKDGIPRHQQISEWLRQKIKDGTFGNDDKLPSENELCEKFGVSRVTVRKALQTLEHEQLIYRSQGLGSFVRDKRSRQSFIQLTDFVEDMRCAGLKPRSSVLRFEPVSVPAEVASVLKVEPSSTVLRLDRLRLGNNQPIAFDLTWLPMFYGQLIENFDMEEETIYGILEREYDIPVEKGYYRIEAENATDYLAKHLDVAEEAALLLIDRLSLTLSEKPIYYQKRYYRSDRIVYELMAERSADSSDDKKLPLREFIPVFSPPGP